MAVLSLGGGSAAAGVLGGSLLGLLVAGTDDTKAAGDLLLGLGVGNAKVVHLVGQLGGLAGGCLSGFLLLIVGVGVVIIASGIGSVGIIGGGSGGIGSDWLLLNVVVRCCCGCTNLKI